MNLEEGSRGRNATSNEHKLISDQEKERPYNETGSGHVNFRLVKAMTDMDKTGSSSQVNSVWPYSVNQNYRCIYRVPCVLRRVNPEAYTPQMFLIGLLHHHKKAQAVELSRTDLRYPSETYIWTIRRWSSTRRIILRMLHIYGNQTVEEFRRAIKRDEQGIRACYGESTDWINSDDFVEMMLLDSVFILVFFMHLGPRYIDRTEDFLLDEH